MNRNGDRSGSLQLVHSNESRRKSRPCTGIDYILKDDRLAYHLEGECANRIHSDHVEIGEVEDFHQVDHA